MRQKIITVDTFFVYQIKNILLSGVPKTILFLDYYFLAKITYELRCLCDDIVYTITMFASSRYKICLCKTANRGENNNCVSTLVPSVLLFILKNTTQLPTF